MLACLSLMWIAGGAALYSLFPEWCEGAQESVIDGTAEQGTYDFAQGEMCVWEGDPGLVREVVDNVTVTRFDNGEATMVPMQALMLAAIIGSAIAFFLNIFGFMMIHTFNAKGIKGCVAALLVLSPRLGAAAAARGNALMRGRAGAGTRTPGCYFRSSTRS